MNVTIRVALFATLLVSTSCVTTPVPLVEPASSGYWQPQQINEVLEKTQVVRSLHNSSRSFA